MIRLRKGWIGVMAGAAIAVTAMITSRGHDDAPGPDDAAALRQRAQEMIGFCDPTGRGLASAYAMGASHMPAYLAGDRARALDTARTTLAPLIETRASACTMAASLIETYQHDVHDGALDASAAGVQAQRAHLRQARQALDELIAALSSPQQVDDLLPKLRALDAAIR